MKSHTKIMMKKYIDIKALLVESLLEKFPQAESDEIEAMITHWLQSQDGKIPFFTPSMRKHCVSLLLENKTLKSIGKGIRELSASYNQPVQVPIDWSDIPYPPVKHPQFKFIDLFAGIGGFRIAFQGLGGKCIFSCEWDKYAQKTYEENFGEYPYGDVRQFTDPLMVPDAQDSSTFVG